MTTAKIDHIFPRDFQGEEFRSRRERIASNMLAGASALLQGAPRMQTAHPEFSQSKIFFYVCGVEIERCYLLIDGDTARTTLFVPGENIGGIRGGKLDEQGIEQIKSRLLIDEVLTTDEIHRRLETVPTLYVLHQPDEHSFSTRGGIIGSGKLRAQDPLELHRRRDEVLIDKLKESFPSTEIADLGPIIGRMRLVKSEAEVEVLRKTGAMAARMCMECMKSTRPGMPSHALEAISDYVFRLDGNCGKGYEFILEPSHEKSKILLDGDMVLVDCGPDYNHYTMDIARIWPVNGRFDDWQRHTYGVISDYHKVLLDLALPGRRVDEIYEQAAKGMLEKYKGDEAGTAILRNMIERGVNYYNHHVGLSVHDAVAPWREDPLQEGMVIAVDPMVWLENVPHRYVRVEDTIVVRSGGCEILTSQAPFEIEKIEELMIEPGCFPFGE